MTMWDWAGEHPLPFFLMVCWIVFMIACILIACILDK